MDNQKEKLIAEIRKLFLELLDEEKERDEFVGKVIRTVYPNKDIFVCKANMLYNKALELEKLDSKYSAYHLNEVMSDEVYMVDKHEYDFDGLIPKPDSVNELKKRMRNAVYHLKLYYNDVLGDIKIDKMMQHLQPNTTLQGGKYRIERVLGQGGFGNTYMAKNTAFDDDVAIKEFFIQGVNDRDEISGSVTIGIERNKQQFEEQREKFKKEARRLWKLKNEHIVRVHDLFEENGTAYYVMDFIDGESLAEKMKKTGQPFAEAEVRSILSQIIDALKEVHQNEIWHLDLKPGNIMIDKTGNAYLIDFGASKQIRANGSMTTSTALCYTPGYAPAEQIGQMFDRFGPWTDIYALGATVYNLLTNKKPPMGMDIEEDEEDAFDFPAAISDEMRKLVIWMMQPKRKSRPQDVDALIENMKTGETVKEEPIVVSEPETKSDPEPALESEETLLIGTSEIQDKSEEQPKNDEETQTILVVSKKNQTPKSHQSPSGVLPQRAIKVGDFIFEDGSYADKIMNDRKPIGVLFSYYGGAHGQILSAVRPNEAMSINGKELKWHEASIAEWVEIIQNLGHCKVNFSSWEYHFFSLNVRNILSSYQVKETKYATRKSVSGVAYEVNFVRCKMIPIEDENTTLPYVYISDF